MLVDRLWQERDGIFAWMVQGLLDFLEGGLQEPERVRAATDGYRRESDPVGEFLTEACVFTGDGEDWVGSAELVNRYLYWLLEQGLGAWRPTTAAKRIAKKAEVWRHPRSGNAMWRGKASRMRFCGIRMVDAFERRFSEAPKDQSGRPLSVSEDRI